ncbi:beta-ketoacyl synthase N-terminal-like domain-containing protein [Streptomyces iconiensis]|uniref:Beta-ketoacyl synthase N-terminal-like domain-containing protein n=1 Tax=Streptomyces iconiensis TaxID=1384038 RepID=A0ABT6ZX74_9ACTN|nr:type I polyketide synthase [Streptomyces iconiensis]MDJ1133665.1 beta-ketoacyl synthase N-terminal-like domain-containing protein [Streptomyces iconiensis]
MEPERIRQLMEEQLKHSRRLQARVRELEERPHAPLAVTGMSLRLPGGLDTPDAYWDFLRGEGTADSQIPEDRPGLREVFDPVPGKPGRSYVDRAGFLSDIAHFDAEFFGISQREAKLLDPQQRMLLETSWEALERAGIAVRRSDRLDVGVYLGMMASEYGERLEDRSDMTRIDPYYTTGGGLCFGAGRISHLMGFRGPVMSVDTACSSSLSALHLAARALRAGECRYALVCGSNLLLSASLMVSLCQTRAVSPTGRSQSFLATADGYGRAEGVGVLVLMRQAEAESEGRPVLATVLGTAVNHDGAASGLTAPNGPAQQEVFRAALADARVGPGELGYVEAHGTGTALGDPIEVGALDAVAGDAVRERGAPLPIGSVKARLGHLEAASGIAAVIKTVLMLQHGEIPAALPDDGAELNPHIPWDRMGVTVPRRNRPWPLPRKIAGVNSFGMSGTNAHVVLEAYEPAPAAGSAPAGGLPELLTLSAKNPAALAELAEAVSGHLKKTEAAQLPAVCHTLRAGRAALAHRIAVTGSTAAELAEALDAWLSGGPRSAPVESTLRTAVLRLNGDEERLAEALAAVTDAFPRAAVGLTTRERGPGGALAQMIGRFGIRVRPAHTGGGGECARLEWETAEGPGSAPLVAGPGGATSRTLLVEALAALFAAGADLRLDALAAPGTRLLGDLPTYPFQRARFWIEEPRPGSVRDPLEAGATAPVRQAPEPRDREAVYAYLMAELTGVLHASREPEADATFLDAGGDSFLSVLFITRIEESYHLSLTAEELPLDLPLDELLGRLADDIAGQAEASGAGDGELSA